MKYQRQIGGFNVSVHCADELKAEAEALLDKLTELSDRDSGLRDGTTIEFGWSVLTLRGNEDELVVCEPYFSNDPFQDYLPVVDETLRVLTEQISLLNRIGVKGVTASFRDKVMISKGCLQADHIYLERKSVQASDDSGWYIAEVKEEKVEKNIHNLESIYVYQLLTQRRPLMPLLSLPHGYLVMVNGDLIEAIFNEDNQNVW